MSLSHRAFGAMLLAATLAAAPPGLTQTASDAAPAPAAPFAYRLGETTLDAARAYWSQNGMKVLKAGHLALGAGSGMDGAGKLSAEKVLLVDVSGVDFEGVSTARFDFFDNRLYRIQASLGAFPSNVAGGAGYSEEQFKALDARLRKKYGPPSQEGRTLMADRKSGNDVLIWKLPDGKLTLTTNPLNGGLILSNEKIEADIKAYVKDYCKTVNTKGRIVCW